MKNDDLIPGVDKPKRWQYPAAALIIVLFALIAYVLWRAGYVS